MATHKLRALAALVAVGMFTSACQDRPQPAPEQSGTAVTQAGDDIPAAETMDTDMSSVDDVAADFVEIIEAHDAVNETNEWVSLARAEEMMVPDVYEANIAFTEGDVYSDWQLWRELQATTRAIVSVEPTQGEKDTPTTAHRTVTARLNVSAGSSGQGKTAPNRMRVHELKLTKVGGQWLVERWQVNRMQDNDAQQAGEE